MTLRRKHCFYRQKYRTKRPNYVWYIDRHDKRKPFGFSIDVCIDGCSRKVIWLDVGVTNKIPDVIARYDLDVVSIHVCPRFATADDGREHSTVEPIYTGLKMINIDYDLVKSFSIMTSPQNNVSRLTGLFYKEINRIVEKRI